MKKTLTILALMIAVAGCNEPDSNLTEHNRTDGEITFGTNIEKVRNCEYIIYKDMGRSSVAMVHAADCTNPMHQPLYQLNKDGSCVFYDQSGNK